MAKRPSPSEPNLMEATLRGAGLIRDTSGETQCRLVSARGLVVVKWGSFEPQQECLGGQSSAIAAKRGPGCEYAMTGHDDRDGIVMVRLPDGAVRVGSSDGASDVGIALCLSVRNSQQLFPALFLKSGSTKIKGHGEIAPPAREIFVELSMNVGRCCDRLPPLNRLPAQLRWKFSTKRQERQACL